MKRCCGNCQYLTEINYQSPNFTRGSGRCIFRVINKIYPYNRFFYQVCHQYKEAEENREPEYNPNITGMKCRNCEYLIVENVSDDYSRGSGHCNNKYFASRADMEYHKNGICRCFSDTACRNIIPRTSTFEIGKGGKPIGG